MPAGYAHLEHFLRRLKNDADITTPFGTVPKLSLLSVPHMQASVFQVMPAGYAHLERVVTYDASTLMHYGMGPWRLVTASGSCGVYFA